MGHIRDMDTDLIITVIQLQERKRIIEVLRICRVNRKGQYITEIPSSCNILGSYLF